MGDIVSAGQAARAKEGKADLPPEVIEKERDVQAQGEPLLSAQEHDAEEAVNGIFWKHQLRSEQRHGPESEGGTVTLAVLVTQRPSLPLPRDSDPFPVSSLFLDPCFGPSPMWTQALRTRTGHSLLAVTHTRPLGGREEAVQPL